MRSPWKLALVATGGLALANVLVLLVVPRERDGLRSVVTDSLLAGHERGFACKSYLDRDGHAHKYAVFVPHHMTAEDRLPLVVNLNGRGENGENGIDPLSAGLAPAIWEMQRVFPFVAVFPQCRENETWQAEGPAAERALNIMQTTAREYHTDPNRVYLTGLSSGGWGVWSVAANDPDLFAAIVPFSAGAVTSDEARSIAEARLPVWSFYVEGDRGVDDANRRMKKMLLAAGASPRFTVLDGTVVGENLHDSWTFGYRYSALYDWLRRQRRTAERRRQPSFETLLDETGLDRWKTNGHGDWHVDENRVLVCRVRGAGTQAQLTSLPIPANVEIHAEFRPDPGVTCGIGTCSRTDETQLDGWTLHLVPSEAGSGGIRDLTDGTWLQPSDTLAQRSLNPRGWNDLRIRVADDNVVAILNGWKLNELQNACIQGKNQALYLSVNSANKGGSVSWRNLRIWNIEVPLNVASSADKSKTTAELAEPDLTAERILDAWARRQRDVRSARFEWKVDRSGPGGVNAFQAAVVPAGTLPQAEVSTLTLRGETVRLDAPWWHRDPPLSPRGQTIAPRDHPEYTRLLASCFEGQTEDPFRYSIFLDGEARTDYAVPWRGNDGRAVVENQTAPSGAAVGEIKELFWRAPLLAYRPFARGGFGICPEDCSVVSRQSFVNGAECVVLEETGGDGEETLTRTFWADPAREFLVLRYVGQQAGGPKEQLDIEYERDGTHDWIPSAWTAITFPRPSAFARKFPGQDLLFEHAHAVLADWSINESVGADAVNTSLPVGTTVHDRRTNQWYLVDEEGSQQPLDQDAIMEIMLASEPTSLQQSFWHRRQPVLWGAAGVLLLAAIALWRRWQVSTKNASRPG